MILMVVGISLFCYSQKTYRKAPEKVEKREAVRPDTSEIPRDFVLDLSKFDTYQRKEYFQNLRIEQDKIPTYFNIGVNVTQNFPGEIKFFRISPDPFLTKGRRDTLTGKGLSSVGFGAHLEFAMNEISYFQVGYNYSPLKFQLDSLGYSAGEIKSELHELLLSFAIYAGPVRINIGDAFSFSKNGFQINIYGGIGIAVWKGLSLSANYQVWGTGSQPIYQEFGYIKDFKSTDRYLYTSTVPGKEFSYQHFNSFQLTLSVDLFFSARNRHAVGEELASYRAWKSVSNGGDTDYQDVPLPIPAPIPVKTNSYTKYSDAELDTMLNDAVKKEQFDTAEKIQNEINRRSAQKPSSDLTTMSEEQLQTKLTDAIQKEDYETAGKIQKELKKRGTEKKENP